MDVITFIATWIGYFVLLVIVAMALLAPLDIHNDEDSFWFTYFEIGFLYAKSSACVERLSDLRQVKRQRIYINAPRWFNSHIYNFGVRKPRNAE